jgi:hypothetical protein
LGFTKKFVNNAQLNAQEYGGPLRGEFLETVSGFRGKANGTTWQLPPTTTRWLYGAPMIQVLKISFKNCQILK